MIYDTSDNVYDRSMGELFERTKEKHGIDKNTKLEIL
jgi:hypothetical protein